MRTQISNKDVKPSGKPQYSRPVDVEVEVDGSGFFIRDVKVRRLRVEEKASARNIFHISNVKNVRKPSSAKK